MNKRFSIVETNNQEAVLAYQLFYFQDNQPYLSWSYVAPQIQPHSNIETIFGWDTWNPNDNIFGGENLALKAWDHLKESFLEKALITKGYTTTDVDSVSFFQEGATIIDRYFRHESQHSFLSTFREKCYRTKSILPERVVDSTSVELTLPLITLLSQTVSSYITQFKLAQQIDHFRPGLFWTIVDQPTKLLPREHTLLLFSPIDLVSSLVTLTNTAKQLGLSLPKAVPHLRNSWYHTSDSLDLNFHCQADMEKTYEVVDFIFQANSSLLPFELR